MKIHSFIQFTRSPSNVFIKVPVPGANIQDALWFLNQLSILKKIREMIGTVNILFASKMKWNDTTFEFSIVESNTKENRPGLAFATTPLVHILLIQFSEKEVNQLLSDSIEISSIGGSGEPSKKGGSRMSSQAFVNKLGHSTMKCHWIAIKSHSTEP